MTARTLPLGVLASGRGSNLQAILDAIASGSLAAAVNVVVSDVAEAFALDRARRAGAPAVFIEPRCPGGKAAYEKRDFCIAEMLKKSSIEIKKGF